MAENNNPPKTPPPALKIPVPPPPKPAAVPLKGAIPPPPPGPRPANAPLKAPVPPPPAPPQSAASEETMVLGSSAQQPTIIESVRKPPQRRGGTFVFTEKTPLPPSEQTVMMVDGKLPDSTMYSAPNGGNSFSSSVATQDLTSEKMLLPAQRSSFNQQSVPTLGGMPLLAKLGQGGMGAVYLGFDTKKNREVAIKVLPFHMAERDPILIDRFFREAQMAMKIQSPNLVSVSEAKEEQGLCYLVMEFVSGSSAGGYLKKNKSSGIDEAEALDICIAATKGLAAAHKAGVIHRDIKPDNILIPQDAATGKLKFADCKVADLGLARSEEHGNSLTGSQASMGTPGYMSPEQCTDARKCGKPADIFSMGACLYALLCGRPPFHGKAAMEVVLATMKERHEPIGSLRPNVTPATAALIDRCLQKESRHRFKDAEALLKGLQLCRSVLGNPAAQAKAIEELRGSGPAAPEPKKEDAHLDDMTVVSDAKPRRPEVEALATENALRAQGQSSNAKMVAALLLAGFLGAGVAMMAMGGGESESTASLTESREAEVQREIDRMEDKGPPAKAPPPAPVNPSFPKGKMNDPEAFKADAQDRLAKSLDKITAEMEKQRVVDPILPVSSVGRAAEAGSSYLTPARITFGFFSMLFGMAYMMYSRKSKGLVFGICGAVLMLSSFLVPSLPLAVMIAGVMLSLPLFMMKRA